MAAGLAPEFHWSRVDIGSDGWVPRRSLFDSRGDSCDRYLGDSCSAPGGSYMLSAGPADDKAPSHYGSVPRVGPVAWRVRQTQRLGRRNSVSSLVVEGQPQQSWPGRKSPHLTTSKDTCLPKPPRHASAQPDPVEEMTMQSRAGRSNQESLTSAKKSDSLPTGEGILTVRSAKKGHPLVALVKEKRPVSAPGRLRRGRATPAATVIGQHNDKPFGLGGSVHSLSNATNLYTVAPQPMTLPGPYLGSTAKRATALDCTTNRSAYPAQQAPSKCLPLRWGSWDSKDSKPNDPRVAALETDPSKSSQPLETERSQLDLLVPSQPIARQYQRGQQIAGSLACGHRLHIGGGSVRQRRKYAEAIQKHVEKQVTRCTTSTNLVQSI